MTEIERIIKKHIGADCFCQDHTPWYTDSGLAKAIEQYVIKARIKTLKKHKSKWGSCSCEEGFMGEHGYDCPIMSDDRIDQAVAQLKKGGDQ